MPRKALLVILCLCSSLFSCVLSRDIVGGVSNVSMLGDENFDEVIKMKNYTMVMFSTDWCGYCKKLMPTYNLLSRVLVTSDKLSLLVFYCDKGKDIPNRYGVNGYPTLMMFDDKGNKYDFLADKQRTFEGILEFMTSVADDIGPTHTFSYQVPSWTEFDFVTNSKNTRGIIKFTTPSCGYCEDVNPTYKILAHIYANDDIKVVDVDCSKNSEICTKYNILGYPTFAFFNKDDKLTLYNGQTDLDSFVSAINEVFSTHRKTNGGLNEKAGKVAKLDSLAKEFMDSDGHKRDRIFQRISSQDGGEESLPYRKIMKCLADDPEFDLIGERERVAGIIESCWNTLDRNKLDELIIKVNVLNSFLNNIRISDKHKEL